MKIKNDTATKSVAIGMYTIIAIGIRYLFSIYQPSFLAPISNGLIYVVLTGTGPLIGALCVIALFKREIVYSSLGLSIPKSFLSAIVPVCLFFFYDLITSNFSFSNTLIVVTCLVYSYCEEFGWRGYLQSELIHLPTLKRILIITFIWFVWHLNFNINSSNALFLLILLGGSWGIGQIAIHTQSIIACSCFHAVVNIVCNMQMDFIKGALIIISILCWFGIWYIQTTSKSCAI